MTPGTDPAEDRRPARRGAHFDAETERSRDQQFVTVRIWCIVGLALICLAPVFDASLGLRALVAIFLTCVHMPASILALRFPDPDRVDAIEMSLDIASAMFVGLVFPEVWWTTMMISAMTVVSQVPIQQRRTIVGASAATAIGFSATGVIVGLENWFVMVASFLILTYSVDAYYGSLQRTQQAAIDRRDAVVAATPVFIWEVDSDSDQFVAVAGNTFDLLGYHPHELIGMHWNNIVAPDDQRPFEAALLAAAPGDLSVTGRLQHRTNAISTFRHVMTADRSNTTVHGVSSDIEELAAANRALAHQAGHDELTNLANRSTLTRRITDAVAEASLEQPVALMVLDLDRFKHVNDTLGHSAGDDVLKHLSSRLRQALPDANTIARLGGDEFAVLITHATPDRVEEAAATIVEVAKAPVTVDGVVVSTAASIGIVMSPEHGSTADELLKRADIAMYEAKRSPLSVRLFQKTPEDLNLA